MSDRARDSGSWRLPTLALALAGGGVLLSLLEVGQQYLRSTIGGSPIDLRAAWLNVLPFWLVLAALAPCAAWMARRVPLEASPRVAAIAWHVLGASGFAIAHALAAASINAMRATWRVDFGMLVSKIISFTFLVDVLVYGAIVGAVHAVRYYAESRERERQAAALRASLADTRLRALRAQINPHVLFNTLNAVSVLALKGDQDGVVRVVGLLSELLRACLDERRGQESPLGDELRVVECYLEIQQIRFGDRLLVERSIAADTLAALVPTLLLQPLVENAITHGVSAVPGEARVRIVARRDGARLALTIADSGPGFGASHANGSGLGLANTRARLRELYGDACEMTTGPDAGGDGARVQLMLPFRATAAEAR